MKNKYIYSLATAALLMSACSKENPFDGPQNLEEGQILKSALAVDMKVDETVRKNSPTRADVNLDDFNVVFTQTGHSEPTKKFKYSEMPDVVTLPAGDYTCTATFGENRVAEWESPYYLGTSEEFTINPYEITSYVAPIVCRLENIKVTIDFDASLKSRMNEEAYVEVKVGSSSALKYTAVEAEQQKAGYFLHTAETTLVATFNGKIDGVQTVETKSMQNIEKGNHYKITFRLHTHDNDPTGDANSNVSVDASVTITDIERNVEIGDEPLVDDTERPSEEPENPTPGPGPDEPTASWEGPSAEAEAPMSLPASSEWKAENGILTLNCSQTITDPFSAHVVLNFGSKTGFTEFYADIKSPTLTSEELEGVGLASHLDLVKDDAGLWGTLGPDGLGLPVDLSGKTFAKFDISQFMIPLSALGNGTHTFEIHAKDANGELVINLVITI